MKTSIKTLIALTLVAAVVGIFGTQHKQSFAQEGELVRTPDGKPGFSGIWQAASSAHFNIEPHIAEEGPASDILGVMTSVPAGMGIVQGGEIPYTEVARRQRDANRADAVNLDPLNKCYLPGVPRANYLPFPFQITQSKDFIAMTYEFADAVRIVYVDQPEVISQVDAWMAHSNATWEGDTLVVTVTGQMPETWFDRASNFHGVGMEVVERYTPESPNLIRYEATITDPTTFTRPWKISLPLYRCMEPNIQLMEFQCVPFSEEFLYGEWRRPGSSTADRHPSDRSPQ